MAKIGIDSFLLDCHADDDLAELEAEFGVKAFAIIVRLWQKIHSEQGYYCEWVERSALLFLSNWFGGGSGVDVNLIREVVTKAIKVGIFDEKTFKEHAVLTSAQIQERYLYAAKRRKEIFLIKEYLLVSVGNFKGNVNIISKNVYINEKNAYKNSTSKGKESKVNNNIHRRESDAAAPAIKPEEIAYQEDSFEIRCVSCLVRSCLEQFPKAKVPKSIKEKQKWAAEIDRMKRLDHLTEEEIWQALCYAVSDPFWKTNIRSTKKFREKFETLYTQSKERGGQGKGQNRFNNFPSRQYDMDEMEKALVAK